MTEAEKAWTDVIKYDERNAAAYSNRANTRVSNGKYMCFWYGKERKRDA